MIELIMPANELRRVLSNCVLFRGDATRPVLQCVEVAVAGSEATFTATDSYGLITEAIKVSSESEGTFLISGDTASALIKTLDKKDTGDIAIRVDESAIEFQHGWTLPATAPDWNYPNWREIVPEADGVQACGPVGMGLWQLARLAKVVGPSATGKVAAIFHITSETKPCIAMLAGGAVRVLFMPVRR